MAETPTHPLLSFPDDEIIRKLRDMDLKEVLKFSLISKRSKELVKSADIKGTFISVRVRSDNSVSITTNSSSLELLFFREPDMYWGMGAYGRKKKLTEPQSALVEAPVFRRRGIDEPTFELKKRDFTIQNWLDHLQEVFNRRKVDHIWFHINSAHFDIDDIKELFGTVNGVAIGNTGCYAFNQMVLEKFSPLEMIHIKTSNFPNSKIPKEVLMQNFVKLHVGELREITSLTLDELFLINSKVIQIEGLKLSAKQFNKFIKLWQKGSNPHMEYLSISYPQLNHWEIYRETEEEDDARDILKGIEHCVISRDTYRNFKMAGISYPERMNGGIDIFRKDGVKATIQLKHYTFPVWKMYV